MGLIGYRPWTIRASIGLLALLLPFEPSRLASASPPAQAARAEGQFYVQWGEVLTATDTWLVLRNREGQQFPVAFDAINLFVIRWPTTVDRISPLALIEVTGRNVQSNRIQTDQVDVFEGAAQQLVTPGLQVQSNRGYAVNTFDFTYNADAYGAPFPGLENPIQGNQWSPAGPMHLVGPLLNRVPLMVGFPLQTGLAASSNSFLILPSPAGIHLSQVTLGSPSLVQAGDIVYFVADSARPRSLTLVQLVVYKGMPLDQFAPAPR